MATLDELLNELKDSSVPPEVVKEYYNKTSKTNPELGKIPAKQIAAGIALAYGAAKSGKISLSDAAPQRVEVTGRRMQEDGIRPGDVSPNIPRSYQAPTEPLDPYKGTGTTPAEILKKQFALADYGSNTDRQAAAEEDYRKQLQANQVGRGISGVITGGVAGFDGGKALDTSKSMWDKKDEQAKDITVGRITREQDFMKNGIAAYRAGVDTAGEVLNQMEKSGKFQIDANKAALEQKKLQLELVGTSANTQVTQQLMDPKSDVSIAMRTAARQMLKTAGYSDATIQKMVPDDMPGIEAAPIAKLSGETLDGLIKKGQAAQANAAAGASSAQAAKTRAETEGVVQGNEMLKDYRTGKGPAGFVPSISAGPVQLSNPMAQVESTAAGNRAAQSEEQGKIYHTIVKPTFDDVRRKLESTMAGKGTELVASWLPANEQQALLSSLAQANAAYPGALPPAVADALKSEGGRQGFNGRFLGALTNQQLRDMLNMAEGNILRSQQYDANARKSQQAGGDISNYSKTPAASATSRIPNPGNPRITPREEYEKLPKGATYVGPDGKTYIKG